MILIDFRGEDLLQSIPEMVLSPSREIPVRFSIANVELFTDTEVEPPRTLDMSVLVLARWGLFALRQVKRRGIYGHELDEHAEALLFKMDGEDLLVHSTWLDVTVKVRHEVLLEYWLQFAERVRKFVRSEFPEFEEHTGWSGWFRGEEDSSETPDASWQSYFESCKDGFNHVDAIET